MEESASVQSSPNGRSVSFRSRITNHRDLLPGVADGRSAAARRFRDITNALANDQGGIDQLSEAQLQLIRRFAAASVLAETMEARLASGEQINVSEHAQICSSLVRLGTRIGIGRRPQE